MGNHQSHIELSKGPSASVYRIEDDDEDIQSKNPFIVEDDAIKRKFDEDTWKVGAQILACIHDVILMEGPASFISRCFYKDLDTGKGNSGKTLPGSQYFKSWPRYLLKLALEILFLVVLPFFSPLMVEWFLQRFSLGPHPSSGDAVKLGNVMVNETRLETHPHDEMVTDVVYLTHQKFHEMLSLYHVRRNLGFINLAVFILFLFTREYLARIRALKFLKSYFVRSPLNCYWVSDLYPNLKFTSESSTMCELALSVFCSECKPFSLFALAPCSWLSTTFCFAFVMPLYATIVEGDTKILRDVLPSAWVTAFAFSKIWMQLTNATFHWWLSNPESYAVVRRQFTVERMFADMTYHLTTFAVTEQEMHYAATHKLMHALLFHELGITDVCAKESGTIANPTRTKFQEIKAKGREHADNFWVLEKIVVKDTSADAQSNHHVVNVQGPRESTPCC